MSKFAPNSLAFATAVGAMLTAAAASAARNQSVKVCRKALALAPFVLAGVIWAAASATACEDGYYRFTDVMLDNQNVVGAWSASSNDYKGEPPHGLSFFTDLSVDQYTTMNDTRAVTRQRTSYVYKIPCDDLVDPLTFTASPTGNTDWTEVGGGNHGVVSATGATSGSGFNKTLVNDVKANKYLVSTAVFVTTSE